MEGAGTRTLFELGGARDEKLLEGLAERIAALKGHGVIVLHMMGSHGPAYYKRYPAAFERFKPACKESQFSRCTTSQIVNSYDNTIVYTDYVLFRLIELLRARDVEDVPTAMVYLSDHGESLGEDNIYLHGLPYAFAPDVQKHIPMVMWLSPKFQADFGVDTACVRQHSGETVSHDNLFHSVLGLLDVATSLYDAKLDVFAGCRSPRAEGGD
jgi:lipid A ethanolaminephosphotransferase